MTSKQRVNAALERKPVDRVPIYMWFHPETTERLSRLLEIPPAYVGEAMGNDIRQTWINNNYAMEGIVHQYEGDGHTDESAGRRRGHSIRLFHSRCSRLQGRKFSRTGFPLSIRKSC
jgi:hypothetical protein